MYFPVEIYFDKQSFYKRQVICGADSTCIAHVHRMKI